MSIETTDTKHVALFDSVTGIAFGPVFEGTDDHSPEDEAEAFRRWFERGGREVMDAEGYKFLRGELFELTDPGVAHIVVAHWHNFIEPDRATFHQEQECPWDRDVDSYGIGYTGDSDRSYGDYTAAAPNQCGCACHRKRSR